MPCILSMYISSPPSSRRQLECTTMDKQLLYTNLTGTIKDLCFSNLYSKILCTPILYSKVPLP